MKEKLRRIVISRTDSIGDVLLIMPLAYFLRQKHPNASIVLLGSDFTKPLVDICPFLDEYASWPELRERQKGLESLDADAIIHVLPNREISNGAKRARIPIRIGTARRRYHLSTCNRLVWVDRKPAKIHEALLNLKLGIPLGLAKQYSLDEIQALSLIEPKPVQGEFEGVLDSNRINLILHPGSRKNAPEWGSANFAKLISLLDEEQYNVTVTGTDIDREQIQPIVKEFPNIKNLSETLDLPALIRLISQSDALVANSTGPLHLAATLGLRTVGLYSAARTVGATRWHPIGKDAHWISSDKVCSNCSSSRNCTCVESISPERVLELLQGFEKKQKDAVASNAASF